MSRVDRWVGLALALLAVAVLWSARSFPNVPGQKVGAGFLPLLVGSGLLLCGLVLMLRSLRKRTVEAQPREAEHFGSALVIVGVIALYVILVDKLGFLLVAPVGLVVMFRSFNVAWLQSLAWALGGTLVVHLAFYKLLRVPLPWGLLRPFY